MDIVYTPKFVKLFRKLPGRIQKLAVTKEKIFRRDMNDQRLDTHKLTGKLDGLWSFSINRQYRIMFEVISEDKIAFLLVGTHEIYRRK